MLVPATATATGHEEGELVSWAIQTEQIARIKATYFISVVQPGRPLGGGCSENSRQQASGQSYSSTGINCPAGPNPHLDRPAVIIDQTKPLMDRQKKRLSTRSTCHAGFQACAATTAEIPRLRRHGDHHFGLGYRG